MTLRLQQRRNDNAYLYRSGFRTSSSDQVFNKKWIDGDTVETDLNLSSLSVSSPSVSSCSATLPFPVYYCKNSDLISVFARYVDPKWILF